MLWFMTFNLDILGVRKGKLPLNLVYPLLIRITIKFPRIQAVKNFCDCLRMSNIIGNFFFVGWGWGRGECGVGGVFSTNRVEHLEKI